jgi:hypothetical protein
MFKAVLVLAVAASSQAKLVEVEQYGMMQCPMTTTLLADFFDRCFVGGHGVAEVSNENMVKQ